MMLYRRGGIVSVSVSQFLDTVVYGSFPHNQGRSLPYLVIYILFLLLHGLYLESTDYSESKLFGHTLYILFLSLLQAKNNLSTTSSRVWTERFMRIFPSETEDYLEPYFNGAHFRAYGMLTARGHGGNCQ